MQFVVTPYVLNAYYRRMQITSERALKLLHYGKGDAVKRSANVSLNPAVRGSCRKYWIRLHRTSGERAISDDSLKHSRR